MSGRFEKMKSSDEQLRAAVKRAISALKGVATLTDAAVKDRAMKYHKAHKTVYERFFKSLSPEERIQLGFPDPNAPKAKLITSPDRHIVFRAARWRQQF